MIKATFPPYNDEVPDSAFKVTPEIEENIKKSFIKWSPLVPNGELFEPKHARLFEPSKRRNPVGTGESFEVSVSKVLNDLKQLLLDKNRKYGNSALEPKRIFSKANAVEQIKVRIDDKLSRLMSGQLDDTEDVEIDLLGYLVLLQVAKIS